MTGSTARTPAPIASGTASRCLWGAYCLIYLLLILYSSTIVGPTGPNFVFVDPAEAFQRLLAIGFVAHGSDQRADWIGNLLMVIPLGFLAAGTIWPRRRGLKMPAAFATVLMCLAAIVAIKYLQLFFPPRTVTLNYVAAQTLGAVAGCACLALWREWLCAAFRDGDRISALVMALRLYCVALLAFILMPLDFALDASDLQLQIDRLPETLLAPPGGDGPLAQRAIAVMLSAGMFIPAGMLLTIARRGDDHFLRGVLAVACYGLLVTVACYILSTLVISAAPSVASIPFRLAGILAGAVAIRWLAGQDVSRLRRRLRALVPWTIPPYLLCLLVANRLLSRHWLTVPEAVAQAYPLGLLPLFDYYIVSKAAAARNIIAHAMLYAPVGGLLWLRYSGNAGGTAFTVAAALSFAAELARYFRPGLQGDGNAVVVAGLAAMLAARLMPMFWSLTTALATHPAPRRRRWRGPWLRQDEEDGAASSGARTEPS